MMIVVFTVVIACSIVMTIAVIMHWSTTMVVLNVCFYLNWFQYIYYKRATATRLTNVFSDIKTNALDRDNCT